MGREVRLPAFLMLGLVLLFTGCISDPFIPSDSGTMIQVHPSRLGGAGYIITNPGVGASFGRGYVGTGGGYGTESGYRIGYDKKGNPRVKSFSERRRK